MRRRQRILEVVERHPGISFSALKRKTGFANGVLQYHLHRMKSVEKERGAIVPTGFCGGCALRERCQDDCLRNVLRDPTKHAIVEGLARGKTQTRIADELGLSKSTITYHIQRLEELGVLEAKKPVDTISNELVAIHTPASE